METLPTPHLEKLKAVLGNPKLPAEDKAHLDSLKERYEQWVRDLLGVNVEGPSARVAAMVSLLNDYRNRLDLNVIFDSPSDFLYRQKGQVKLDNSVIEEFLPILIKKCVLDEVNDDSIELGPRKAFSAIYFTSTLDSPGVGGSVHVRTKDQDFTVARRVYLQTSYSEDFEQATVRKCFLAYVAAECKTNLDKTMFQEASATAHDVKAALVGARYFLICEWLDMTPQSTSATDIDEVLILRKAKRMSSNIRSNFGSVKSRKSHRSEYVDYLDAHPFSADMFERFVNHISGLMMVDDPVEQDVLVDGYF